MSEATVLPQAVYRQSREPGSLPDGLRLRALEWALYFAVDGIHSAAELGRRMRAEAAERDQAFSRLISLGILEERELDATEYLRALAASSGQEEKTLREFLAGIARRAAEPVTGDGGAPPHDGGNEIEERQAALDHAVPPSRASQEAPAPALPSAVAVPRGVVPVLPFRPLPHPDDVNKETRAMPESRRLSLRALMNHIESEAGSREAGQLDIYRVFVRVDTTLLKRNGIETLRFTDDRLVSDPELEQALVKSVQKTLGLSCPESVWVDVA